MARRRRSAVFVGAIVLLIWMIGMPLAAQVRVLSIDQTQTFETSLRLEVFARRLKVSGMLTLAAQLAIPVSPWEEEPYRLAVMG